MKCNETHVTLLAKAFAEDPLFLYLFPNKNSFNYRKKLIRFLIKRNQLSDDLLLTDDQQHPGCVAIIDLPANLPRVSFLNKLRVKIAMAVLTFQLPFHALRSLTKYRELTSSTAPEEPHYYVTMIGVDPASQGKGLGKSVLKKIHEIAASSSHPVALDTENEQNVAYYEHLGYELTAVRDLDGLPVYCMVRAAEL